MNNIYLLVIFFVLANCDNIVIEPEQIRSYWCRQGGIEVDIESSSGLNIDVYNIEKWFTSNKDITVYSDTITSDQVIRIDLTNTGIMFSTDVSIDISCFTSDEFDSLCSSTWSYGAVGLFLALF